MALQRNVLQEDDILCELYLDTHSIFSDYSDNKCLEQQDTLGQITKQIHKLQRN